MTDFLTLGYAAFVATGGIYAYVKVGSRVSIVMALFFASLIFYYGAYKTPRNYKNYYVALGVSIALTLSMGKRFLDNSKIMPGLVSGISFIMALRFGARAIGFVPVDAD